MEGTVLKQVITDSAEELASNVKSHMEECSSELTEMLNHLSLLNSWTDYLSRFETNIILKEVVYDLLSSVYISTNGMYRNAYSSLRSAIELGIGFVYFTDHNYDFLKWKQNKFDLSWSLLNSESEGVLNKSYLTLFFSEFNYEPYIQKVKELYRECSEFTHGKFNYMQTIESSKIAFDKSKFIEWAKMYVEVIQNLIIILRVRFSNELISFEQEDNIDFMNEIFINCDHRELKINE